MGTILSLFSLFLIYLIVKTPIENIQETIYISSLLVTIPPILLLYYKTPIYSLPLSIFITFITFIGLIILPYKEMEMPILFTTMFILQTGFLWLMIFLTSKFINRVQLRDIKHKNTIETLNKDISISESEIISLESEILNTSKQLENISKVNKITNSLIKTLNKNELINLISLSIEELFPKTDVLICLFEKTNTPAPHDTIGNFLLFPNLKRSLLVKDISFHPQLKNIEDAKSLAAITIDKTEEETNLIYGYISMKSEKEISDIEYRLFSVISDIAKVALLNSIFYELTQELAITDSQTNLFVHKYFKDKLKEEVARAKLFKQQLSLLIIDVDDFKRVNDTLGHPKGDELLKIISSILRTNTREIDTVARYGGDEFAIILPGAGKTELLHIASKLKNLLDARLNTWDIPVKVSVGGTFISEEIEDADSFIKKSDQNLYNAKSKGKNTIIIS